MKRSGLRAIPSVDKLAIALGDAGLPHPTVVATIRRELAALRKHGTIPGFEDVLSQLRSALGTLRASRLQPMINGTGILVHTNFGRAPLGHAVIEAISRIGSQYNNLEYEIGGGGRGVRAAYLEHSLALLCGSEAATVVNNNASALVLILRHLCKDETRVTNGERRITLHRDPPPKNQVVISRGELVQIGTIDAGIDQDQPTLPAHRDGIAPDPRALPDPDAVGHLIQHGVHGSLLARRTVTGSAIGVRYLSANVTVRLAPGKVQSHAG
jgi:hypothetical protein